MGVDHLREKISRIGSGVLDYHRKIEASGYVCCFFRSRWFASSFSKKDWECHIKYLAEYARESLLLESDSAILFDDEYECRSEFLRSLKRERYDRYGSVKNILGDPETSHLIEISPCYREHSRIRQASDPASINIARELQAEFLTMKENEILMNLRVSEILKGVPLSFQENEIQEFYCNHIYEVLSRFGFFLKGAMQSGFGVENIVYCDLGDGLIFIIRPTVSYGGQDLDYVSGVMGMGYLIARKDAISSPVYQRDLYSNLNISALFPEKLESYGFFRSKNEFCLNILAFGAAINSVIDDILMNIMPRSPSGDNSDDE